MCEVWEVQVSLSKLWAFTGKGQFLYDTKETSSRLWTLIGSEVMLGKTKEWYTHIKVVVSPKEMALSHV